MGQLIKKKNFKYAKGGPTSEALSGGGNAIKKRLKGGGKLKRGGHLCVPYAGFRWRGHYILGQKFQCKKNN